MYYRPIQCFFKGFCYGCIRLIYGYVIYSIFYCTICSAANLRVHWQNLRVHFAPVEWLKKNTGPIMLCIEWRSMNVDIFVCQFCLKFEWNAICFFALISSIWMNWNVLPACLASLWMLVFVNKSKTYTTSEPFVIWHLEPFEIWHYSQE